jgi:RNA-directed DNA polymerase
VLGPFGQAQNNSSLAPLIIGIPTLEDKVLQRAVLMVLEPVYEQDFLDCSDGFRPGRRAHQALEALWKGLMNIGGGWVIDLDIRAFFDSLDRTHLNAFLDQRVRDGVIRRALGQWMQAGVMEDGVIGYPERGRPQGGVISPLVSNVYLHEVLDQWCEREVKPRLRGRAFMVRFADDGWLAFEREDDARRVMEVRPKRFERFGLALHPEKTRRVDFRRPSPAGTEGAPNGSADSTCSASPTTGGAPGRGVGWCNARRPSPASAARCGRWGHGVGSTVTDRCWNSSRC